MFTDVLEKAPTQRNKKNTRCGFSQKTQVRQESRRHDETDDDGKKERQHGIDPDFCRLDPRIQLALDQVSQAKETISRSALFFSKTQIVDVVFADDIDIGGQRFADRLAF